jgi:hypothetical protein
MLLLSDIVTAFIISRSSRTTIPSTAFATSFSAQLQNMRSKEEDKGNEQQLSKGYLE